MNRTKIEWTDYTWNPVTGCEHGCDYCYAKKITERFKSNFPNGFKPTYWPDRVNDPYKLKKPSKIFTGSMTDLFGAWTDELWLSAIVHTILNNPQHTFQILTKDPGRIESFQPITWIWPRNVWLGATIEHDVYSFRAMNISSLRTNGIKFISFEPLLNKIEPVFLEGIDWIIIGGLTGPLKKRPKSEWVKSIIQEAEKHDIPVFLKNNLGHIFDEFGGRQEYPEN